MATDRGLARDANVGVRQELMLIDGDWVTSAGGRFFPVENPAHRGSVIAEVPRSGWADADRAVNAAARAFEGWKSTPPRERGKLLMKIADAFDEQAEQVARTISLETGNAIRTQSRGEARGAADLFRYFGGLAGELKGETIPLGEGVFSYTVRESLGVVGAIVPWNAPVTLACLKITMALAAGNTLVLKPAEEAPLAVLEVARICAEHLPPGVLNVITGFGEECGAPLAERPLVRKLSFTGSTEVGKSIMHASADRIVPVSLELGGKSPQIVYPDAVDDAVVQGVIAGMRFSRQGQSCTAGSRLYLHQSIFDPFLEKLSESLGALKIGNPLDESTDMGAIINQKQFDRVCGYIEDALRQDEARAIIGGMPPQDGPLAEGYFAIPTLFTGIRQEWRVAREEVFGPVLVAIPWSEEEEVIRMANDTHYGLAAFVWTHDISRAIRTANALEAGWVLVNQGGGQVPGMSYGGYKQSGMGREWSLEGMLDSYTQRKNVNVNLQF